MIEGVLSTKFLRHWDKIRPAFENFVERSDGRWTMDYLVDAVLTRQKQVWNVADWRAVLVTSVGPDGQYVTMEACYGEGWQDWYAEMEETVAAWAKALGAKRVFCLARPGWSKALKAQGYREIHREFVKEL